MEERLLRCGDAGEVLHAGTYRSGGSTSTHYSGVNVVTGRDRTNRI